MGLIKAFVAAGSTVLGDQWKEYFMCESLDADTLVVKGVKKTSSKSSNTNGSENVITKDSVIAVADGQCMLIVEQGKVVEVCAEAGAFIYDSSSEPSIFAGNLGESIIDTFKTLGSRFTFGGDTGKDQRVYYVNLKEIISNKYGTATPVPFRVVDQSIGLDIDIAVRCNGEFSYKISNPILFYTNVCGNVSTSYNRRELDSMIKSELLTALQPAFAKISAMGVRYSAIPGHTMELAEILNDILSAKWKGIRGIEIVSFGVNTINAPKEDEDMIKELQRQAVYRNTNMAAARMTEAQADAMVAAAGNEGQGAFMAFAGMNIAQQAGGANAAQLFQMGQQPMNQQGMYNQQPMNQQGMYNQQPMNQQGMYNQQPMNQQPMNQQQGAMASSSNWTCICGKENTGKFCMECGTKAPVFVCDKCGWKPEDPRKAPKFCPECGDVFDDGDRQ